MITFKLEELLRTIMVLQKESICFFARGSPGAAARRALLCPLHLVSNSFLISQIPTTSH